MQFGLFIKIYIIIRIDMPQAKKLEILHICNKKFHKNSKKTENFSPESILSSMNFTQGTYVSIIIIHSKIFLIIILCILIIMCKMYNYNVIYHIAQGPLDSLGPMNALVSPNPMEICLFYHIPLLAAEFLPWQISKLP